MERIEKEQFTLAGLQLEGKTTNQNNQSDTDCGNLWQRFEQERILDFIPNKINNEIYAVYYAYEKDETAPFSYFIGCKVKANTTVPKNLYLLEIPSQNYCKVTAKGAMTGCITKAWEQIWSSNMNRKFGFDFEIYDERSHDWKHAEVDIFISMKEHNQL